MMNPTNPILIVDDEVAIVSGYRLVLSGKGLDNLVCCTDSREAREVVMTRKLDLVLLDLVMPHVSGSELLEEIGKWQPGVPAIVVTGRQDVDSAVECMKKGAHDYLVKPASADRVVTAVRNALRLRELQQENERLGEVLVSDEIRQPECFADMATRNGAMMSLFKYVEAIAGTGNPVLITGETGVGKELMARAIHKASGRKGAFVAVNVAGLDDTLFSDALFGHRKGAFTGAETARAGVVESAAAGTLFLDEIGDLALPSQIKLLRLLQNNEYTPLGSDVPLRTDARVVVATNADLVARKKDGKFRADLFYRLNTHNVRIPPLRERLDDLPLLVDRFLLAVAKAMNKKKPTPPTELFRLLAGHTFPGNIRELESMISDAVSRHESGMLSLQAFKAHIELAGGGGMAVSRPKVTGEQVFGAELPRMEDVKRLLAEEAMRRAGGNCSRASELIGTTRQAIMWHVKKAPPQNPRV